MPTNVNLPNSKITYLQHNAISYSFVSMLNTHENTNYGKNTKQNNIQTNSIILFQILVKPVIALRS